MYVSGKQNETKLVEYERLDETRAKGMIAIVEINESV